MHYLESNIDKRVPLNGLAAWWDAADYDQDNKQWPRHKEAKQLCDSNPGSLGGWGCKARVTSGHPKRSTGGNNAANSYPAIVGFSHNSGDNWNFGNIAPAGRQHTLCTTSKYDGGHRGRIFTGHHTNWLHGHWGNNNGVSHYDHWIVSATQSARGLPVVPPAPLHTHTHTHLLVFVCARARVCVCVCQCLPLSATKHASCKLQCTQNLPQLGSRPSAELQSQSACWGCARSGVLGQKEPQKV